MEPIPLLLLHGALGSASQFTSLSTCLNDHFDVHTFDFSGHGANIYDGPLTIDRLADDLLNYLDDHGLECADIFGYSMGGYAAANLAIRNPYRINRIITLATKWHWDVASAEREVKMLDPDTIIEKVPAFAASLNRRHTGQSWKKLLQQISELMMLLGHTGGFKEDDFRQIQIPVCVCLGSEDRMVSYEESINAAQWIHQGTFRLINEVPHPIEKVDVQVLSDVIQSFLLGEKIF